MRATAETLCLSIADLRKRFAHATFQVASQPVAIQACTAAYHGPRVCSDWMFIKANRPKKNAG